MDDSNKNNLLNKILFEAKAYNSFEDIEKLVDSGTKLTSIPIQPLYVSLISSSSSQLTEIIPKLSKEQRQAFIDLDLWRKDIVDPASFEYWLEAYSRITDDDINKEFATSEDFYLYLKSRVTIQTFDTEDPMYPDHDYYFLTDDMLLLVEYGEDYQYPNELKIIIKHMYYHLGVEGAYTTLFKLINDSYSAIQEEGFQNKKERLREYGFVDHFEAMEKLHPFISVGQIRKLIKSKSSRTGLIDVRAQNQSLHSSALVSFNVDMEKILIELAKVESDLRKQFLHFTFIRLINSSITLKDALKAGRIELTKIGAHTRSYLDIGLDFIKGEIAQDEVIFDRFDFFDIYKIGSSLISIEKKRISKALKGKTFEEESFDYFVGSWWRSFLDNSSEEIPRIKNFGVGLHAQYINDIVTFSFWQKQVSLFVSMSPFIEEFAKTFVKLKEEDKLQDSYYINYSVDEIDFEAIIISSFINFSLKPANSQVGKLGLSISEFKQFTKKYFNLVGSESNLKMATDPELEKLLSEFSSTYGLNEVKDFDVYLYGILYENLSGYDYDNLSDEDFEHVGGPILLSI
jgi:hypothetical protein